MLTGLVASAVRTRRYEPRADPHRFPAVQTPEDCDTIATALIAEMSLEEKLDQLSGDLSTARFSFRYAVGLLLGTGIPLFYSGRNERLGIPPLAFADGPRGVNVGRNKTCFPVTMARGASFDPKLEEAVGVAMGRELRATGANYSGAVCVNLLRHPGWGRAQETYGEDPVHVGAMGVALTRGIQSQNVMACVKHLALNSIENSRFYVDMQVDEVSLRQVYLPHFKKIVQEGRVASVMSAYNKFRGEHCGHSHTLLTRILREEWGFAGFVSSDWMHGVRDGVAGFKAGLDVEMPAKQRYGRPLRRALQAGSITEAELDRMVHRILRTRMWYALAPDTRSYGPELLACSEHVDLARRVAEESMVLLKNEAVLPFDPAQVRRLGVFGRLATMENTGDRGSSAVLPPSVVTPLDGLTEAMLAQGGTVDYCEGGDLDRAAETAESVDAAVVVVGLTHEDEGEWFVLRPEKKARARRVPFVGGGGDRQRLALRPEDEALIERVAAVQSRTVVVCIAGSALTMPWRDAVPAILFAFYSGMEGGRALASLLFGAASPSGKLPFTIPDSDADLPPFEPFAETAIYGPLHGYTLFQHAELPVAYPFGHGLSYAEFSLTDLSIQTDSTDWLVSVVLNNHSAVSAAQVIQVYLSFPDSEPAVPRLAAFQKVMLAGHSREVVSLVVPADARREYDPSQGWVLPSRSTTVSVGLSSGELALNQTLRADSA